MLHPFFFMNPVRYPCITTTLPGHAGVLRSGSAYEIASQIRIGDGGNEKI